MSRNLLLSFALVILSVPLILTGLTLPQGCGPAAVATERQQQFDRCRAALARVPVRELPVCESMSTLPEADVWGRPLCLTIEPVEEPGFAAVTVRSAGPDGVFDTGDDVVAVKYVRLP